MLGKDLTCYSSSFLTGETTSTVQWSSELYLIPVVILWLTHVCSPQLWRCYGTNDDSHQPLIFSSDYSTYHNSKVWSPNAWKRRNVTGPNFNTGQMFVSSEFLYFTLHVPVTIWLFCLLFRLNAKLGGINVVPDAAASAHLSDLQNPTIIMGMLWVLCLRPRWLIGPIGADVMHPAPGSDAPSFSAVVGSVDSLGVKYIPRTHAQTSRLEIIADLHTMAKVSPAHHFPPPRWFPISTY